MATAINYEPCEKCGGTGKLPDGQTGAVLRKERERAHVDIGAVAGLMDYSAAYISDLERGNRNWSNELVEKYRRAVKELAA